MENFKRQKIKAALKQLTKIRGLTYADLADQLECSVPTVKRYFGPEDLTLSRLIQICEILEVTLGEVELLANGSRKNKERFSAEQETFLVKNRGHLAFLFQLFEGLSPLQIAEKFKLTRASTDKYLIALERQELIRVTGAQRVRVAFKDIPYFDDGPLGRAYYQSLIEVSSRYFKDKITLDIAEKRTGKTDANSETKRESRFSILKMNISKESYDGWVQQQEKILQEITALAGFEEKSKPPAELQTMVCVLGHTLSDRLSPELATLDHVFGEIKNL